MSWIVALKVISLAAAITFGCVNLTLAARRQEVSGSNNIVFGASTAMFIYLQWLI